MNFIYPPERIVLPGSSKISLTERFKNLKNNGEGRVRMTGLREPRNFLYDDYMDTELYSGADDGFGTSSSGRSTIVRRGRGFQNTGDFNMPLDTYAARRGTGTSAGVSGLARARPQFNPEANRFAAAMGIASTRRRLDRDVVHIGSRPRIIEEVAPRRQVVRRVVSGDYDDEEEVVEVVRRVPARRRVQVVRKVPIQQRVVKKIIVTKGNGNAGRRGPMKDFLRRDEAPKNKLSLLRKGNAIQKKKVVGGGGRAEQARKQSKKPKLSAAELDRELDEYMRSSKHPRVEL